MKNKFTTIGGYVLIAGGVLNFVAAVLMGTDIETAFKAMLALIAGGTVAVGAADGGR